MATRSEELRLIFGEDFDVAQTPETMAFSASMEFSTSVIKEMKSQDMLLKDLAERIGVTPATLCAKLNGKANLTLKSAADIAYALNCDLVAPKIERRQICDVTIEVPWASKEKSFETFGNKRTDWQSSKKCNLYSNKRELKNESNTEYAAAA